MLRILVFGCGLVIVSGVAQAAQPRQVDFNRDVRPILSETCFRCHGPDSASREADLRLDKPEDAFADRGDYFAIRPGKPRESEAYQRLVTDDETLKMPPPESRLKLTDDQIETLRLWIEQGANYEKHWSFITPRRPALPTVQNQNWPRNEIDHFILAKLESHGLKPRPQSDKETLIRRLSLDITGLPPTIEEIDAFMADDSVDAYEKLVDRLLASPAYGERMALLWLDAARYADTNGYQNDAERYMWRWRDWVINAFNQNMPFDQFTTEQLAGDLLPNPTLDQRIATGFNRNHTTSDEGGIIPEEYRVEYVANRLETMSTVWLGLTVHCARCHTHKYDPITQKEYYQLFAFFNNIPEKGKDGDQGNSVPFIKAPTPRQLAEQKRLEAALADTEAQVRTLVDESAERRLTWESGVLERWDAELTAAGDRLTSDNAGSSPLSHFPFDCRYSETSPGGRIAPAHVTPAMLLTGEAPVALEDAPTFEQDAPFTVSFWVRPAQSGHGSVVARRDDKRGWDISLNENRTIEVRLLHDGGDNAIDVYARGNLPAEQWTHVAVTYDGLGKAAGVKVYRDGVAADMKVRQDTLAGNIASEQPLSLAWSKPDGPKFRGAVDDLRLAGEVLNESAIRDLHAARGATWETATVTAVSSTGGATFEIASDGSLTVSGENPPRDDYLLELRTEKTGLTALRLDALTDPNLPKQGPGRRADGAFYLSEVEVEAVSAADPSQSQTVTFTAAYANESRGEFAAANLIDGKVDRHNSWSAELESKLARRSAVLVAAEPFGFEGGTILKVRLRHATDFPSGTLGRFRLSLTAEPNCVPGVPEQVAVVLATFAERRSDAQQQQLQRHYVGEFLEGGSAIIARLEQLQKEKTDIEAAIPTSMVMQEMEQPRQAYLLMRGQYDQHGEEVQPNVPAALTPLPDSAPANRLGLAQWLTAPDHPLTARVTMNRFWKPYFGTGIVKTDEDFGSQGEWPEHVDLLDWLATEFIARDWDIKAMQKLIVMSAAYRQDAAVSPDLLHADPQNRLISRGPRFRMSAEMIRDNALAASGLLVPKIGGPSVKPYQPPGLWKEVSSGVVKANLFEQDHGDKLYRRSLYTFWKRAAPPPALQTFDAPTREYCVTNRSRTNTPLQALVLMNDVTYVEAARMLAQRTLRETIEDPGARVRRMFRLAVGRGPSRQEHVVLLNLLKSRLAFYQDHPEAAAQLLSVGEAALDEALPPDQLAAWTNIASVILCLDETITKG